MTTCPTHNQPLQHIDSHYGPILVCPVKSCNYSRSHEASPAPQSTQRPARATERGEDVLERTIVARIISKLEEAGYDVCVVGQRQARGSGSTEGYPDLSVRRSTWPRGLCVLLEVKTATGKLRPAQQELHDDGWSHVVRSAEDALAALSEIDNIPTIHERR